jgi:secondary thiamine-phosphate synthase enzyme
VSTFAVRTGRREEFVDVTADVAAAVRDSGVRDGVAHVYVSHTTAGVTINESADPAVKRDILTALARLVPHQGDYRHAEGNSDAHVKSSLMGASASVPVADGKLALGTWQGVFFCEFDGPRMRTVRVTVLDRSGG